MPHFGWTRLAYLLFVLVVLTALVHLASLGTDPRPLASEPRDGVAAGALQTNDEEPREPAREPRASAREPREPAKTAQPASATLPAALPASVADRLEDMATDVPGAGSPYTRHTRVPVFERPPPAGPAAPRAPTYSSGPVCGDLENFARTSKILFPLPKTYFDSYDDTWGAPRPQGGHEGTDLMVPTGTPEYALTDGTVVPVAGANRNGWNSLGGYAVMVEAAYSVGPIKKGDLFYYAHLDRESALKIGTRVRAGQVVGYAGDTGQGPEVTRGLFPPHLHLGWYDATGSRSAVVSGAMNPYPLLEWIKANGGAITGGSDVRYCQAPQTGTPTPSAGPSRWPKPDSPGVRPDLDTGSHDPRPSPAIEESRRRTGHLVDVAKKAKPARQRAKPAMHSGRGTKDDPAAAAKEPQPLQSEMPKPKPSHPKPAAPDTTPAELPVLRDQRPQPPGAGSPNDSHPSETAKANKHYPSGEEQGTETGENKKQEAKEHDREERPRKDPEHDSRPSDEHTSPEEDPPPSETTEPQTAGEAETDPESTVPETIETTTETTVEVTTTE
jgi:murein DD-endopeptidase MepM/ murein hydrolase activator NlpD